MHTFAIQLVVAVNSILNSVPCILHETLIDLPMSIVCGKSHFIRGIFPFFGYSEVFMAHSAHVAININHPLAEL